MKPLPTGAYTDLYFSTATIKGWKHLLKPVQEKWRLAAKPEEYPYSSASLYVLGDQHWPFLRHFWSDMD